MEHLFVKIAELFNDDNETLSFRNVFASFLLWLTLSLADLLVFDGARRKIMIGPFLPAVARLASAARIYGGPDNGCLRMTSRMILAPSSIVSPST
jgi:hypothetical protein